MVYLYVDGMLILGTNIEVINKINIMLTNNIDMKEMGEAHLILGMKISRTLHEIFQTHYVDKMMIERFKIHGINEYNNPFHSHVVLHKSIENGKK